MSVPTGLVRPAWQHGAVHPPGSILKTIVVGRRRLAFRAGRCIRLPGRRANPQQYRTHELGEPQVETELKLLVDPKHVQLLRKSRLLHREGSEPVKQRLLSTYYDTPDLWLHQQGASLRVRQSEGEGWLQTVKGNSSASGGLHRRDEWETPLLGPTPDLKALLRLVADDLQWSALLSSKGLQKRLTPLFTTDMQRVSWTMHLDQGDLVEVALDQGRVRHEAGELPINELELELKEGVPVHLFDFALRLQEAMPEAGLRIGNQSKAQRGFSLVIPDMQAATKAEPIVLDASPSCSQALQAILLNCLRQVEANVDGVVEGDNLESVHQMRVGLRRLQSALMLFRRLAPLPAEFKKGFADLRHALGNARDAEVLAGTTLPELASRFSGATQPGALSWDAFLSLQREADMLARERRAIASKMVAASGATRLLLGFCAWVVGERWRDGASGDILLELDAPVCAFVGKALRRQRKRLLEHARHLGRLEGVEQHQFRIAAKKLRYTSEFFSSLLSSGKAKVFGRQLSRLQDDLGLRNDARVADGLLAELAGSSGDAVAQAAGFARGCLSERGAHGKRRLMRRWKAFEKAPLPRIAADE